MKNKIKQYAAYLDDGCPPGPKLAVSGLLVVLFAAASLVAGPFQALILCSESQRLWIIFIFAMVFLGGLLLLVFGNRGDGAAPFTLGALVLALALMLRVAGLDFISGDYRDFLSSWAESFRALGVSGVREGIGDYNVPYMYFLLIISRLNLPALYTIKLFSICFDVLAAYFAMKLASLFTENRVRRYLVFTVVLFLPTVFLNSSFWAQCDSVYTALIIMSLYFALRSRPCLAVILAAAAFSFKLQAIFILPIFIILLLKKYVKLRHLLLFPAAYFVIIIPALIMGKPLLEALGIYTAQINNYAEYLTLKAPTIFALISGNVPVYAMGKAGIFASFAFLLFVCYYAYVKRDALNKKTIFILALLFAIGIPFFLPRMHERYFYMADILCAVYGLVYIKRLYLPVLVSAGSYAGYQAFLFGEFPYSLKLAAIFMLLALVILIAELLQETNCLTGKRKPSDSFT